MKQIIVLGGGAAGLMAAIQAARQGAAVTVLEHNEKPGRKLLATGNGKCNLTNTLQHPRFYHSSQPEFPWAAVSQFPLAQTLSFFTELGVYTKNKKGGLYPHSEQAISVLEALRLEALHQKVKLKLKEEVQEILPVDGGFQVKTSGWSYLADAVICCLGGPASSVAGSSSSGFDLARALGHHIVEPLPALVGLRCRGKYFSSWAGVRAEGSVSLTVREETLEQESGELQLTEYGISGIPVFQLSGRALRLVREGKDVSLRVDFFPDMGEKELLSFLKSRQEACPYKNLEQLLLGIFPEKLIRALLKGKPDMEGAVSRLKSWELPVLGASSLSQAQVVSGGVDPREINPFTLESRLVPGLYFAGEVIDVDGACGGYNLQWAWSSGALAGKSSVREKKDKDKKEPRS